VREASSSITITIRVREASSSITITITLNAGGA